MIREKVGHALNTNSLQSSAERERPVDVVGAMGVVSHLGSLLFRMKYAGAVTANNKRVAVMLLARKLHPHGRPALTIVNIARLAVEEWLMDRCLACGGRGMTGGERDRLAPRRMVCKTCAGAGSIVRLTPHGATLSEACAECLGRGVATLTELHEAEPLRPCLMCAGTGRLALTDAQRARFMNATVFEVQTSRKRLNRALDILRSIDRETARRVRAQLANVRE